MARAASVAERWWAVPPTNQVSYLLDSDPELLAIGLDPLPSGAPAVVRFRPATLGPLGDQTGVLLDELDRAAVALFPSWLPGAERLDQSGLGAAAVRALASEAASRSHDFGPFLADLAERALLGAVGERARFPAEVRAAGLARVVARAYDRVSIALLLEVPDGLTTVDEWTLVAAAEWLARHGRLAVWLAGAPLRAVDRVPLVSLPLPAMLTELVDAADPDGVLSAPVVPAHEPIFRFPPLSGLPRADSDAEQTLERSLAACDWAQGRCWNHTYHWHVLGKPYRLDLFWPVEGLVVEVDGPEHRGRLHYADDRRRDAHLQLLGHHVLRFTNEQVLSDVQAQVLTIKQMLHHRRTNHPYPTAETRQHVDH